MMKILSAMLFSFLLLLPYSGQAQLPSGVTIIVIMSITPEVTEDNPEPLTLETLISFNWPLELGGMLECRAFMDGVRFWRPAGDLHAVMNCVDVAGE